MATPHDGSRKEIEKYYSLFNSMDVGYCIIEILYDNSGKAYDWRYLEVNPAFERHNGLYNATGKTIREMAPDIEQKWVEIYARVAETGESIRFEEDSKALHRNFDLYAFPIGDAEDKRVAVLFTDITERKQRDTQQEFLLKLNDALRSLADPVEIEETVTRIALEYFNADRCYYCQIIDGQAIIKRDSYRGNQPSVAGVYPLDSFAIFKKVVNEGSTFIVNDANTTDILDEPLKQLCLQLGVISFVDVPIVKNQLVTGILCVVQSSPREWSLDEIILIEETAERTWAAVERAKAEDELLKSKRRFESIANLVPDLLWESEPNGVTNWCNQRWLEYTGQSFEEAIGWGWTYAIHPDDREASAKRYGEVIKAGKPLRQQHRIRRHDGEYRWFVVTALPLKDENGNIVKMYGAAINIHDSKQAEDALRLRESQLARVQEVGNIGGVDIDVLHGLRGERSPEYLRLHGLPPDLQHETHQDWLNRLYPADREKAEQNLFNALNSDRSIYENEYRIIRPNDGALRWIYARLDIERNDEGKAARLVGMHMDITQRKQAEEALQESEEQNRAMVSHTSIGIFRAGLNGAILFLNDKAKQLFGFNGQEGIGANILELTVAEFREATIEKFQRLITEGTSFESEKQMIRTDGSKFWASVSVSAIKNPDDSIRSIVAAIVDISHRKEAEEALYESEARMRITMDTSVDYAIINMNEEGLIESWSRGAELTFGYTEAEIMGKSADIIFTPEDRAAGAPDHERNTALVNGVAPDERWHIRKDGTRFYMSGVMRPIYDNGTLRGFVKVARDLTEEQQTQETLRQSERKLKKLVRQQDEFIAVASHELKTPITSIKTYAELLLEELEQDSNHGKVALIERMNKQIDRLTNLVKDLLDASKITDGGIKFSFEEFDLPRLISERVEEMSHISQAHNIQYNSAQLPLLTADRERIGQVIMNLLSNAIDYSPEGGNILVTSMVEGEYVKVTVQDSGIGIPRNALQHVFERFYRVNNAETQSFSGMGLGLFISADIVRRHGGTISVESEQGRGSVFSFTIPITPLAP